MKDAFNEQFNEINNVIKGLKADFTPTKAQVSFADEFMAAYNSIVENGGKLKQITPETNIKICNTSNNNRRRNKSSCKSTSTFTIFKRLQEVNPVVNDLNIISITDNSLDLDREEISLLKSLG